VSAPSELLPELVLIMRHARVTAAHSPAALLNETTLRDDKHASAVADLTDIGRALAEALQEMGRAGDQYSELLFLHEPTRPAELTASTLRDAYAAAREKEQWSVAPSPSKLSVLGLAPVSPYSSLVKWWRCAVHRRLVALQNARGEDRVAVAIVGHDPRMSWLVHDLTGGPRKCKVPGLAHTELIALYRIANRKAPMQARWALSPSDDKTEEAVRAKVRSKMEAAKVFAAVLTAVATFVAERVSHLEGVEQAVGLVGFAFLGTAIVLYLITMFWYDRLTMPPRFWATTPPQEGTVTLVPVCPPRRVPQIDTRRRPNGASSPVLIRPPSNATWILYQNMQIVWSRCFIPATVLGGLGLSAYVLAASKPNEPLQWVLVAASIGGLASLVAALGRLGRPVLGVQD
jgi:hypothetical protein